MDGFTTFAGGEDCYCSWHGYNSQKKGADHPCDYDRIGYNTGKVLHYLIQEILIL